MSAPLRLDVDQLRRLASFLADLTHATGKYNVRVDAYGSIALRVDLDATLEIRWDDESQEYVIDDRVGS